nr:hypothetical protein [Moraxella sp. CTOTU47724]
MRKSYNEVEVYLLIEERSSRNILNFLTHYLKEWKVLEEEFIYPAYSDNPIYTSTNLIEFLEFLDNNYNYDYNLYFETLTDNSFAKQLIAVYPSGKFLIIGLVIDYNKTEKILQEAITISPNLKFAYVDNQLPEIDYFGFINSCKNSDFTKLIEGKVIREIQ